jgi:diguanylate cyclase (GGDEF)-like protein
MRHSLVIAAALALLVARITTAAEPASWPTQDGTHTIRDFRFVWQDKVFDIGVSIGVVPIDGSGSNLADVLAAADAACYVAKDMGRNRVVAEDFNSDLAIA